MPDDLPALRNELARLTAVVQHAKSEAGRNLYLMGDALRQIRDRRLWAHGDYTSFADYLRNGAAVRRSFAYSLMSVAAQFNVSIAERYGVDKLDAIVAYTRATGRRELPGDVLATDINVRDAGGTFRSVPLHDASAAQIRDATKLLRERAKGRRKPPQPLVDAAERMIDRLPPVKGTRRRGRVTVRQTKDGTTLFNIRDIPADWFDRLAELAKELPEDCQRAARKASIRVATPRRAVPAGRGERYERRAAPGSGLRTTSPNTGVPAVAGTPGVSTVTVNR